MRISWIPFSLLAFACHGYYEYPSPDEGISVEMMSHSFNSPFQYDSSASNWYLSGATIPVKNYRSSVIMNPHILNRHGFLLNTKALKSRNFDATFMVHMDNGGVGRPTETPPAPRDQTFAIWFTEQNISAAVNRALSSNLQTESPDYQSALSSSNIDILTGIPKRFKGVGIVLTLSDSRGEGIPSVSIIESDGRSDINLSSQIPSSNSVPLLANSQSKTTSLVHQLVYLRMRIKVRPDSIALYIQDRADWRLVKEIRTTNIPVASYFGMTAFTGTNVANASPYRVRITSVHLKTFDLNALNTEDNASVLRLFTDQGIRIEDLVSDSAFATTYTQTEILKKLLKVVDGYIKYSGPVLKNFDTTISSTLMAKLTDLEGEINVLSRETKMTFQKSATKSSANGGGAEKTELVTQVKSIHEALKRSQADKIEVLSQIKSTADGQETGNSIDRHVGYYERQMDTRNRELNEAIDAENRFTLVLFLIVFVSALAMGIMLYMRLNAYAEKAHLF